MDQSNFSQEALSAQERHEHGESFREELLQHLPYAIFSVAAGILLLSLLDYTSGLTALTETARKEACSAYSMLFHSFHFLHVLFAATGTVITFSRFSRSLPHALVVGLISPIVFCLLSDMIFPFIVGRALGVEMKLCLCFIRELRNVLPFLFVGVLNGLILRQSNAATLSRFSVGTHVAHILVSSLAGLFYIVSHGFYDWYPYMGLLFLFLVGAVVIPCSLSDLFVPMYWAGVTSVRPKEVVKA